MPELVELNLADLIDVKGMKAMGNRLSAHVIQTIELIAEHDDPEDVPDPAPDSVEDTEPDEIKVEKPAPDVEPEKAAKNIDFEISNPDDIDIDDSGQLGLF